MVNASITTWSNRYCLPGVAKYSGLFLNAYEPHAGLGLVGNEPRCQPAKARKSEARILTEKPIAGFRSLTGSSTIIRHPMSICEYQAKATAAMQMAAAATCESDRSDWLRVALTWQDLARVQEDELSASPQLSEQREW